MKQFIITFCFIQLAFFSISSFSQIPMGKIEKEIRNLKTEKQKEKYWKKLEYLDQEILLNAESTAIYDSISIDNMIRTAMMFEIHGVKDHIIPIVNLSHNYIDDAQIAYWAIILQSVEKGGVVIKSAGGGYPAYQLESISMKFYNGYSLLNQESIYPQLLQKIKVDLSQKSSSRLFNLYEEHKKLQKTPIKQVIGKWKKQSFKDWTEIGFFELVATNNDELLLKNNERLQKLILIESNSEFKYYRVENEPFGWFYKLDNEGDLSLINDENQVLISYSKYD